MNNLENDKILEHIEKKNEIVLVGAGKYGVELLALLAEKGKKVVAFYDNAKEKQGKYMYGIPIQEPTRREGNCIYIICMRDPSSVSLIHNQLLALGILEEDVVAVHKFEKKNYETIDWNDIKQCKEAIEELYFDVFQKKMNWDNPITYNEKLNWEKIYDPNPLKTRLADKYLVRNWVFEKIGEEYLTRLYGVWDKPEEIDYDALPSQFVLKTNNGSGRNIIVTDKTKIEISAIKNQLAVWLKKSHYPVGFEIQYRDITPKIICEEYLEGVAENLYDYDVFCFHGEPKYILCIKGSHRPGSKASFYDLNWNKQEFSNGYPIDEGMAPKPDKLDEMLELSRKLSQGFKHARVDWYEYPKSRHGILFSEITFTTWAGLKHFFPPQYDEILGKLI